MSEFEFEMVKNLLRILRNIDGFYCFANFSLIRTIETGFNRPCIFQIAFAMLYSTFGIFLIIKVIGFDQR